MNKNSCPSQPFLALFPDFFLVLSLALFCHTALAVESFVPAESTFLGTPSPPDQPTGWIVLPTSRPFPILLSDPRDLKLGLRHNNKKELEADVGAYRSVMGWKGEVEGEKTIFHTGIEGAGYFLLRKEGAKFPLQSSDGLIGVYGEASRGPLAYQLRYTHISAHLSDGLFGVRTRETYTRETLSFRVSRQWDFVRAYLGYHFLAHTQPVLPKHSLQIGTYAIFPLAWKHWHPYAGADYRLRSNEEGRNLFLTLGVALVSELGAAPLRLGASYLKGHDLRGQFFREKTDKWTFGLDIDF